MAKEVRFHSVSYKGRDGRIRVFRFPTFFQLRPVLTRWLQREAHRSDIFMLEDQRFGVFEVWMKDGGKNPHRLFGFAKGVNPIADPRCAVAVRKHFEELRRIDNEEREREANRRLDAEEAANFARGDKKQQEVSEYCATEAVTYGGSKSIPSVVIDDRSAHL